MTVLSLKNSVKEQNPKICQNHHHHGEMFVGMDMFVGIASHNSLCIAVQLSIAPSLSLPCIRIAAYPWFLLPSHLHIDRLS